jgi:hypothetical protein
MNNVVKLVLGSAQKQICNQQTFRLLRGSKETTSGYKFLFVICLIVITHAISDLKDQGNTLQYLKEAPFVIRMLNKKTYIIFKICIRCSTFVNIENHMPFPT